MADVLEWTFQTKRIASKLGAVVFFSLVVLAAKQWWWKWQLEKKLNMKWQLCQQTLKEVEDELQQSSLPVEKKEFILSLPLSALQSKLQKGELKAVDTIRAYQSKALEVNTKLNCVVEAFTDAQKQATACDAEGDKTRLLHGIPLSLKENIGVKGYDTTAGLQINIGVPCEEDSVIVQVFKRHGAIPFIRTNIPQAMLSYACSNPIFGTTVNPHSSEHCPGGSSGGEGAVIAAGGSVIGLGTDMGGSVRIPAAFCGICALKPTLGRFSKQGVYSVYKGQTHISGVVGLMAQDVHSLVIMLRTLSSPDMFKLDPALPPLSFQEQLLSSTRSLRIGYYSWDGILPPVPAVTRAVKEAKTALESLGHMLVEFSPPEYFQHFFSLFIGTVLGADRGQTLRNLVENDQLAEALRITKLLQLPGWIFPILAKIVSLKDPYLAQALQDFSKDGRTYSWFCHVIQLENYRYKFINKWRSLELDAVICPAFPSPAPKTVHIGRLTIAGSGSALYNLMNFPAGVIPVTKVTVEDVDDVNNPALYPAKTPLEKLLKESCCTTQSLGLPIGLQCVTLPFREELCLRVMKELEAAVNYKAL